MLRCALASARVPARRPRKPLKSVAINPTWPQYVAVATEMQAVLVFDTRMSRRAVEEFLSPIAGSFATHVEWHPQGTELLAAFNCEYACLLHAHLRARSPAVGA